jgi:hypothetical protein
MSFTGRIVMITMDREDRDGNIDVFVLVVDVVKCTIAVSEML